jgi:hypothetical protein
MATKYFLKMALADDITLVETAKATGRPADAITSGTANDSECGRYTTDGFTYADSAVFAGVLSGAHLAIVNGGDYRKDRLQLVYFAGGKPAPGSNISNIQPYSEGGNEAEIGRCTQNSVNWQKYSCDVT